MDRAPAQPRPPGPVLTYASIAVLCVLWGSTWLVIRRGLVDLPPLTSAGIRFAIAAVVFAALVPWLRPLEGGTRPPRWMSSCMALLTFSVPYGVVYHAETLIPSGLTSVIWAVYPMLIAVSGHFLLPGERLSSRHWAGFALGFAGVGVLFLTDLRDLGAPAIRAGGILLLSPLSAAIGQTLIKRHGERVSSTLLNRNGLIGGAVLLSLAGRILERDATVSWSGQAVFSVTYLSVMGTVVTFGLYFWLLRYAPAHKLSLIAYVTPVVALTLGWSIGQENIGSRTLVGTGLILSGVVMVMRRRSAGAINPSGEPA